MNLLQGLIHWAADAPNLPLFEDEAQDISTERWLQECAGFAGRLSSAGVEPGDRVVVLLERGLDAARAIYAALWCGAAYVPIDPSGPPERSKQILQDVKARLLIGRGPSPDWLDDADYFDLTAETAREIVPLPDLCAVDSEQIAAVLYTSGSTGTPKGVAISHRAVNAFMDWCQEVFGLDRSDRIASLAPFHFDLSLFDLFCAPSSGATTCFMPDRLKLSPARLADWLAERKITCWYTVPSILAFLALKGGLQERPLPALRQVLFAGEVFPTTHLLSLLSQLPQVDFYNLFGPTETNVCLYWPVDRQAVSMDRAIPIGESACQASLTISADDNELLVKGPCLMSGYWQQDGAPRTTYDADGWFHTGDKVSQEANGRYHFHGRLDRMIKSAGYRVEPAEIESLLNSLESVDGAAVVSIPDPVGGSRIAVAVAGKDNSQQNLRKFIDGRLPGYMRPAYYLTLDQLPILSNGKTDYQAVSRMIQETFR